MKIIKLILCEVFGHKAPGSKSTSYTIHGHLFWQCPRCRQGVAKAVK